MPRRPLAKTIAKLLFPLLLLVAPAAAKPVEPMTGIVPRFDALAQQIFDESGVPGMSVGIVYKGEVVFLKGYGIRTAGQPDKVDPDTIFQLASCSKPLTTTALAALVGQGKISWDDKIQESLPEFELSDSWVSKHLTYRDVLSHHSGLPGAAGDMLENLGYDRETVLERLRYLHPTYEFRAGYAYANYGFTAGGEAAARAVGKSYEDMMAQTLFEPAGMTSTSARYSDFAKAPNHASPHQIENGRPIVTVRMPQAQAPAGGISSNARDMARWLILHLEEGKLDGKTLIPESALAQTYRIHSLTGENPASFSASGFYGLGWVVSFDDHGRTKLSHSGAFITGIRSIATIVPQEEVGIVVLTNAYPTALPEALSACFMKLYEGEPADLALARTINTTITGALQKMLAPEYTLRKVDKPLPPLPLARYTGTFSNDFFGDARVVLSKPGELTLHLGEEQFPLKHLDRDAFVVVPPAHTYEDLSAFELQFAFDGSGQVTGFRQNGLGVGEPWFASTQSSR